MPDYARNHIVTQAYLALFARDQLVSTHFVKTGRRQDLHPSCVAVRRDFYVVSDRPGERDTSLEQALARLEAEAVPVLRTIAERWPLDEDDARIVTEFLALQVLRSPAWRHKYERILAERLTDSELAGWGLTDPEHVRAAREWMARDRQRVNSLTRQVTSLCSVLGSMHWTLLRFSSPVLLTSDHPVVPVPLVTGRILKPAALPESGWVNTVEARFPVDPRHVLLLTWLDDADDRPVRTAPRELAANINFGTRSQAEVQYFHRPKTSPPHRAAVYSPVAMTMLPGYGAHLQNSRRRKHAAGAASDLMKQRGPRTEMNVMRVRAA